MADKLADQISYLIAGAAWRLEGQIRASAGSSPVSLEQWRVLALLIEQNGRTMSDLAQHAFVEPPTLTKMVDRMVADTLVYRVPDSHDRRRILIFLSDRGRERYVQLQPAIATADKRIILALGRANGAALRQLLQVLASTDTSPAEQAAKKQSGGFIAGAASEPGPGADFRPT